MPAAVRAIALALSLIAPVEARADAVLLSCSGTNTTKGKDNSTSKNEDTVSVTVDIVNKTLTIDADTWPILENLGNVIVAGNAGAVRVELDRLSGRIFGTTRVGDLTYQFAGVCKPARKLF